MLPLFSEAYVYELSLAWSHAITQRLIHTVRHISHKYLVFKAGSQHFSPATVPLWWPTRRLLRPEPTWTQLAFAAIQFKVNFCWQMLISNFLSSYITNTCYTRAPFRFQKLRYSINFTAFLWDKYQFIISQWRGRKCLHCGKFGCKVLLWNL